jgi:hypothetical protein
MVEMDFGSPIWTHVRLGLFFAPNAFAADFETTPPARAAYCRTNVPLGIRSVSFCYHSFDSPDWSSPTQYLAPVIFR